MVFNSCVSVWLSGCLVSVAPLGVASKQAGVRDRTPGGSGDARKDASRVFCPGVTPCKFDLHLFPVLPGGLQWSFFLPLSSPSLHSPGPVRVPSGKGRCACFPWSHQNNLPGSFWKAPGPWWHLPGAELSDPRGHTCLLGACHHLGGQLLRM